MDETISAPAGTPEAPGTGSAGAPDAAGGGYDPAVLAEIQQRVLWLATRIIDAANHDRETGDGVKVGGHQASSASLVTVMTALYFAWLDAPDRVSVKPHASPVFHAVQYLLGNLDRSYLTTLRAFGGLQSYPSRTKDPDGVDFSTGSVGLGAAAPLFAAAALATSPFPRACQGREQAGRRAQACDGCRRSVARAARISIKYLILLGNGVTVAQQTLTLFV